jgi:16S rRNA C967 or C1407 C5-methylase (RsmB/RsmF family)
VLQAALLRNGFRQLREGGVLVYSTCSFARSQVYSEYSHTV